MYNRRRASVCTQWRRQDIVAITVQNAPRIFRHILIKCFIGFVKIWRVTLLMIGNPDPTTTWPSTPWLHALNFTGICLSIKWYWGLWTNKIETHNQYITNSFDKIRTIEKSRSTVVLTERKIDGATFFFSPPQRKRSVRRGVQCARCKGDGSIPNLKQTAWRSQHAAMTVTDGTALTYNSNKSPPAICRRAKKKHCDGPWCMIINYTETYTAVEIDAIQISKT